MNWKNWLVSFASAGLLAACGGGGGDAGSPPFGGGSGGGAGATASLVVSLSKTSVTNAETDPVDVTVTAVNSAGVVVANAPIAFEVNGGQLISNGAVTDASGKLTAKVDFTADKSNRVVTIKVKSGSVSETRSFSVTGVRISTTAVPAILEPGAAGYVDVLVADANNAPISGIAVTASSPAGSATSLSETGTNTGTYRYSYTVPSAYAADQFVITVTAAGVSQVQNIAIQQGGSSSVIPNALGTIGAVTMSIEPSVIGANEPGSSANQATVKLTVFDDANNPVPNVRVSFDENRAVSRGSYSTGSSIVYTNSAGKATTSFIPGESTTGANGLVLRACYSKTDFTPNSSGSAVSNTSACPAAAIKTGTIVNEAINVTIGSNDAIEETSDGLRYVLKYAVQVVNASGQAKANVQITPTLDLLGFETMLLLLVLLLQ